MKLAVRKLRKSYGDKILFRDLNFEIETGEFVTLIGRSGLGKSTLLNILGSFDADYDGAVIIDDIEAHKPDMNRVIIFQSFDQLLPWKTIKENIEFPLIHTNRQGLEIDKVLERLDLKDIGDLYPSQISGGMKQRVALGRAIITKPEVLLMDEPFGSLDISTRKDMQELIVSVWKEFKISIVFVTHDVSEAIKLGDRIMVLSDQKVFEVQNPIQRPRKKAELNFQYFESELIKYIK